MSSTAAEAAALFAWSTLVLRKLLVRILITPVYFMVSSWGLVLGRRALPAPQRLGGLGAAAAIEDADVSLSPLPHSTHYDGLCVSVILFQEWVHWFRKQGSVLCHILLKEKDGTYVTRDQSCATVRAG